MHASVDVRKWHLRGSLSQENANVTDARIASQEKAIHARVTGKKKSIHVRTMSENKANHAHSLYQDEIIMRVPCFKRKR